MIDSGAFLTMATMPHELAHHLEVLANLLYLIERQADDAATVRRYTRIAENSLEVISNHLRFGGEHPDGGMAEDL